MRKRNKDSLISAAHEVFLKAADEAGTVAYIPRFMATTSFPSSPVGGSEYRRNGGCYSLSILAPAEQGLPHGTYPRLLMAAIATRVKITHETEIFVDDSMNNIFRYMGKISRGGQTGSIQALKAQKQKLLLSTIIWQDYRRSGWSMESMRVANKASMVWQVESKNKWDSTINIDQSFYDDVIKNAVPVDWRVLTALSHYPLAWDIYCWLTYRYYGMRARASVILWTQLVEQFGCNYKNMSAFRANFKKALKVVSLFYTAAKYEVIPSGIRLFKSKPHVPPKVSAGFLDFGDKSLDK